MIPLDDWRARAQMLDVAGARVAWWSSGENDETKPWLLLIHGYPTSSWDWTGMWEGLAARFRLVALDMLGFGLSDKPRAHRYRIAGQADLQEALLAHLAIPEAHVFAHDYGVTVVQELLARREEGALSFSLPSVCFLNGGLFPEMHRARMIQKLGLTPLGPLLGALLTREKLRAAFDGIFGPDTKASDAEIDAHWALMNENDGRAVLHKLLQYIPERRANRARWVGALQRTSAALRLINGGTDPVSGAHLYHHYRAEVPNADAVLFDALGHYPHTEAPDAVLGAFLEFHRRLGTFRP